MARNGSGTYSLPGAVNPVVTGTAISTTWGNTTLNDLAAEITNSLAVDGQSVMTGQVKLKDGSAGSPGLTFGSETNTGILRVSSGVIGVSIAAVTKYQFSATSLLLPATPAALDNSLKASTTAYVDSAVAAIPSYTGAYTAEGQILVAQAATLPVPVQFPIGGARILNGNIALSVASNALTIALKGLDGNDPSATNPVFVQMPQNSSGAFDGTYSSRKVTAALSLVVSSGSTLGQTSAVAGPVYFYLIDNAGALELAVSAKYFGSISTNSTTAEGGAGAADSATVLYSTTARTNVSTSIISRWKTTQTTAGTWAATTGERQLFPFPFKYPLTTVKTSGSGTYTANWDATAMRVRCVGGGSSGSVGGSTPTAGNAGSATTFGTLTANGGAAAPTASGNVPAAATASGGDINIPGGTGSSATNAAVAASGGLGASSFLGGGGGGGGGFASGPGAAQAAAANSGAGGGGGGSAAAAAGSGGCSGAYSEALFLSPVGNYSYGVGTGGSAVSGNVSCSASGAGAAGIIIIEEMYYT